MILDDKTINWHETNYAFQSNLLPIPIVEKNSAVFSALEAKKSQLEHYLLPGKPAEINGILYRLSAHYPQMNLPDNLMRTRAEEYAEIMNQYPLKVVHDVYREIILDKEIRFYPTVAELNERAQAKLCAAKWKLQRILKLIERAK